MNHVLRKLSGICRNFMLYQNNRQPFLTVKQLYNINQQFADI